MSVLRAYIVRTILRSVGTVVLILTTVFTLVQFVGQLDDVGTGAFGLREATLYALLGIPRTIVESLPAAALIGALFGLGQFASQSELLAMRAAGLSKLQLLATVGLAGGVLAAVMAILGESFAPSLGAYARELRRQSLLEDQALADGQSTWLKVDNVILNVRRDFDVSAIDSGVYLFQIGATRNLELVARATSVEIDAQDWTLTDYAETRFADMSATVQHVPRSVRSYGVAAELLGLSAVRHDLLDTPALERYIAYLRANGLDASRYLAAYWSRWSSMVATPLMALLALPFAFGGLRSAGAGARLVVGLVIGLALYVTDEIFSSSGVAFGLDPLVVAWAPTALLAVVAVAAVWRSR